MAYTAVYVSSDLAPLTIDITGQFLAGFAGQAGTLAVIFVIGLVVGAVAILIGKTTKMIK